MPYSFISGNCEDELGKSLAEFWKNNTGDSLHECYSIIGIINDSCRRLDGVVLFTEYTGSNIELHFLGYRCINRQTIKYIVNYVFNHLKCNVLRVKPHETNKKVISLIQRLGFVFEAKLEQYYGENVDAMVYKIKKEQALEWM